MSVYELTVVGKILASTLRNCYEIPFCIDRDRHDLDRSLPVIVAMDRYEDSIMELLH